MIIVYTDGGARGNPGPAAIGVYIVDDHQTVLARIGKVIGETTNNVAEYRAVIEALQWLIDHPALLNSHDRIHVYMDSNLVASQLNGIFRVKDGKLAQLVLSIRTKEPLLGKPVRYAFIPRAQNKEADRLVNRALDNTA